MKRYTEGHEWFILKETMAIVGITDYAQKELGDVVYIELPKVGHRVGVEEEVVVIESTKAAVDIYSPLAGEIIEVNTALIQNPELVNKSAEDRGWLFKLSILSPPKLEESMDETTYRSFSQGD
ncbi:MAG: glycine cleavage system protein GcvH [Chlamydiia bacterium]|nr:glycine cleavage system protein GcvH [Chlamydiia bacterium]